MRKKGFILVVLIFFLFLSLFLFSNIVILPKQVVAQSQNLGCCANPGTTIFGNYTNLFYCNDIMAAKLTQDECCPDNDTIGKYNESDPFFPKNQTDCQLNYWKEVCLTVSPCDKGCCFDNRTEIQKCEGQTQAECLPGSSSNAWAPGFPALEMAFPENPCYKNETDADGSYEKALNQCPDRDPCYGPENETECNAKKYLGASCLFCPEQGPTYGNGQCFTQCDKKCGGYSTDLSGNGVCDSDVSYYNPCPSTICETTAQQSCKCGDSLAKKDEYCCWLHSKTFTDEIECETQCNPFCSLDSSINITKGRYGNTYRYCICGQDLVIGNLISIDDTGGWCCDYGGGNISYRNKKCFDTGNIEVYVKDDDFDNPVDAQIFIGQELPPFTQLEDGHYIIIDKKLGNYSIRVSHPDYFEQVKNAELVRDGETVIVNFSLIPKLTRCDNPNAVPYNLSPYIECSNTTQELTVRWNNPCPNSIEGFYVYRIVNGNRVILTYTNNTYYADTTFPWNTLIKYKVGAKYKFGKTYNFTTAEFNTGVPQCLGHTGEQICYEDDRYNCSSCNAKSPILPPCGVNTICLGPNSLGQTVCKQEAQCAGLGNPLGVFYARQDCYETDYENSCYYDYSDTTVDKCYDCTPQTTCFNYSSEDACDVDNCYAGEKSNCIYDYTNIEFGKGICYEENYTGTDKCYMCNEFFMNCDEYDCSNLGRCFYADGKCNNCSGIRCSDYTNQTDCNGGQNFEISSSCKPAGTRVYSKDVCNLKYCKWVSGVCIKDANDDGIQDSNYNDYRPPVTTINIPYGPLEKGDVIRFTVDETLHQTFFCIDTTDTCCPITYIGDNITIPPPNIELKEGWYYLRYYSKDGYNNLEKAKSAMIYVDIKSPDITIDYSAEESQTSTFQSNLDINISLNEYAYCKGSLTDGLYSRNKTINISNDYKNKFYAKYFDLYDGHYSYQVNCTDISVNFISKNFDIYIDRVKFIFDETPISGSKFAKNQITLGVSTTEQGTCMYSPVSNGHPIAFENLSKVGQGTTPFTYYKFEKILTFGISGKYTYMIRCEGAGWEDTTQIYFTIDILGPQTKLIYAPSDGYKEEFSSSRWYGNFSRFEFDCTDLPAYPDGFGCNITTRYCEAQGSTQTCNPQTSGQVGEYIIVPSTKTYCYYTQDLGGNKETTHCDTVRVDSTPPSKPNVDDTSPVSNYSEYYFMKNKLRVKFNATDNQSGVDYYWVRLRSRDNLTIAVNWTEEDEENEWIWFEELNLQNGTTYYFDVKAVDRAGLEGPIGFSNGITIDTSKIAPHCNDGIKNLGETGIDCGGIECLPCNQSGNCSSNSDCLTNFCNPRNYTCMVPTCFDGYRDGNESGKDCGGNCTKKCGDIDTDCYNNDDCTSGQCDEQTHLCMGVEDHCSNGVFDQDLETDVDCGKECSKCGTDKDCDSNTDCESGKCGLDNKCEAPSCDDGIKNGYETDVDCGGACGEKCDNDKACITNDDCESGNCLFNVCSGSSDEDNDGLPDDWEQQYCEGDCDPNADPDDDKLINLEEQYWGTDPYNADTDGDGHSDYEETKKGTDPLDPSDYPKSSWFTWFIMLLIIILILVGLYVGYKKYRSKKPSKPKGAMPTVSGKQPVVSVRETGFKGAQPIREGKPLTRLETIARPDVIKKRREEKEKEREKMFEAFEEKKQKEKTQLEEKPKEPQKGLEKIVIIEKPSKEEERGDVWERLSKVTKQELTRMGKSDQDVHAQLAAMYGKRLSDDSVVKLSNFVDKELITKSNIVNVFTELAREKNLSKGVLKNVLSKMVQKKRITKAEVKDILDHLLEKKAISKSDVPDILSYIDLNKK